MTPKSRMLMCLLWSISLLKLAMEIAPYLKETSTAFRSEASSTAQRGRGA